MSSSLSSNISTLHYAGNVSPKVFFLPRCSPVAVFFCLLQNGYLTPFGLAVLLDQHALVPLYAGKATNAGAHEVYYCVLQARNLNKIPKKHRVRLQAAL